MLTSDLLTGSGVRHGFLGPDESLPPNLCLPAQVHGTRVVRPRSLGDRPADGLWQRAGESRPIGVRTADCVPVLLAHQDGTVAAIHAGWRGVAGRIVERFLVTQEKRHGRLPQGWRVAMGPTAGGCCYEIGPDVVRALRLDGAPRRVDLRDILRQRLQRFALSPEIIGPCTICSDDGWASYRREGAGAARNIAWIAAGID